MRMTYKVKKGDTLWSVAKKLLGDGSKYREIVKLNNLKDTTIFPDMVLKIPTSEASKLNYEEIGKAFVKAVNDVDSVDSVNKLYKLIGV